MKAIVLSGGHGTRLRPLTYSLAKQLIPIANKPMLFYAIEDLVSAGIKDIGIIVGHTKERIKSIKETVGDGSRWNAKITFIEQDAPRGLAHAVLISEEFVGDAPFAMYLGDNILKGGIKEYVDNFKTNDCDAGVLIKTVDDPSRFGVVELDGGKIVRIVEKPKEPKSNLAALGIYFFRKPIFDAVKKIKPSWRNELEITDAIQTLITDGYNVKSYTVNKGWFKDTGRPEDILEANHLALEDLIPCNDGKIDDPQSTAIVGRVCIGGKTAVHQNTRIVGPVIIGENCEIGPNVYIGPFTSIGNNCLIKNSEIEYSVVMEGVIINTNKRITNSLVGNNVKILSNNSLSNSCRFVLGDSSIVSL